MAQEASTVVKRASHITLFTDMLEGSAGDSLLVTGAIVDASALINGIVLVNLSIDLIPYQIKYKLIGYNFLNKFEFKCSRE